MSQLALFSHYKYLYPYSAGMDFRRQNLTSKVDPRTERVNLMWASVVDDGPPFKQHWDNVLCLLGIRFRGLYPLQCGDQLETSDCDVKTLMSVPALQE